MDHIRPRLTYANVMVTVLAFIVLTGGGAVALGSSHASNAVKASSAVGPWRIVGGTNQPKFGNWGTCYWHNYDGVHSNAAFVRDPFGFVHLKGTVVQTPTLSGACQFAASHTIFVLPPGFRPARRESTASWRADDNGPSTALLAIIVIDGPAITALPAGAVSIDPSMDMSERILSLDSISFRCAPSGQNGCP